MRTQSELPRPLGLPRLLRLPSSAADPALSGAFCNTAQTPLCISIASNGETFNGFQGSDHVVHLTLTPGTYSLTVNDNSRFHNFELRSCPNSTSRCGQSSNGTAQPITTVADAPGLVTVQTQLDDGWYRLFCNALMGTMTHEDMGMYVDIQVVDFGPGSNLRGANLAGAGLQGQDLQEANLKGVDGTRANFAAAQLQGANLQQGTFTNADFDGADLQEANLQRTDLTGATFVNADLTGANLLGANLTGASLAGATLDGANVHGVTWSNTTCPDGTNSNSDSGTCVGHL